MHADPPDHKIAQMTTPFRFRIRVRYVECDMQGHAFNAHYLTWFDMAHAELMSEALGRRFAELINAGSDVVVAECGIRYMAPAHFDDELEIEVEVEPASSSSLTSHFRVRREGDLITEAFVRHVWFDLNERRKQPWPKELREALVPYVRVT
jgi:acyl-CoA thioester hydrolase